MIQICFYRLINLKDVQIFYLNRITKSLVLFFFLDTSSTPSTNEVTTHTLKNVYFNCILLYKSNTTVRKILGSFPLVSFS